MINDNTSDNETTVINNSNTTVVQSEPANFGSGGRHVRRHGRGHRDRSRFSVSSNFGSRHHGRHRKSGHHDRRIFHRIVRPSYRQAIYYDCGPSWTFSWVWPYHHRKYVFVSLGGYWPTTYRYRRYYWYGYHPYYWYGYEPIAYPIGGDTYNYYTYNSYYYDDSDQLRAGEVVDGVQVPDYDALSAVREKLEKEAAEEPDEETETDRYFDEAVKAFEEGDYPTAVARFHDALELEPDDVVLPFAYAQALFANDQYAEAVEVLRKVLAGIPAEEGIFYPRGLYPSDDVLNEQIDRLAKEALNASEGGFNPDLELLLGYQLLGVHRLDEAAEHLENVQQDYDNRQAATLLLELLEKLKDAEQKEPLVG